MAGEEDSALVSEQARITGLRDAVLRKLENTKQADLKQLSRLIRTFFTDLFSIESKYTLEEIQEHVETKALNRDIKDRVQQLIDGVLESEYLLMEEREEKSISLRSDFRRIIIELTNEMLSRSKLQAAPKKEPNPAAASRYMGGAAITGDPKSEELSLINILDLIKETHFLITQKKMEKARENYKSIIQIYAKMPPTTKKQLHFHIRKLYQKF